MRSFVGTLLVTITCIVSVYSLQCEYCKSFKEPTCNGELKNCSHSEDKCFVSYFAENKGNQTVGWVDKGCKRSIDCTNATSTLSNPKATISFGVVCCSNSSCTIPEDLFPTSKTPNNLTCTSCYSTSLLQCKSEMDIQCSGNEKKCGRLLISSKGSVDEHWSMRGCATEEFCSSNLVTPYSSNLMRYEKKCTDSSSTLKLSILILTVAVSWTMWF